MPNELIERARKEQTPIIDGEQATFLWEGKTPPVIVGDFSDWEEDEGIEFTPVEPNLWAARLSLPPDAYVEYAFLKKGKRVPDPYNSRTVQNGLGNRNHYFYMPASPISLFSRRIRGIPNGKVREFNLPTDGLLVGKKRKVFLYFPPVEGPYPLLVVFDGQDYLRRARLPKILDNLIGLEKIRPVGMAMVESLGDSRTVEYACSEATTAFTIERVLPLAGNELDLQEDQNNQPENGVLGASMGGLMALFTALRAPHLFGKVLSQSGAFSHVLEESVIYDLVKYSEGERDLKVWMDVGKMESLLAANRRMRDLLMERGFLAGYREYSGGHNYTSWMNDIWHGLETLFPPGPSKA